MLNQQSDFDEILEGHWDKSIENRAGDFCFVHTGSFRFTLCHGKKVKEF